MGDCSDLSNPAAPKQTYEKVTGKQVNMISQSWDGKRVYITSSLLANWDKGGSDNEQFMRGFTWDGKELKQVFEVECVVEELKLAASGRGRSRRAAEQRAAENVLKLLEA